MATDLGFDKSTLMVFVVVFIASYTAVIVTSFTECHPIDHYWQVTPNPGECAEGHIQFIILGSLNVLTTVMLLFYPVYILKSLEVPTRRKLQLYLPHTPGVFVVAITGSRLGLWSKNYNFYKFTAWEGAELLTAAIAANAPALSKLWALQLRKFKARKAQAQYKLQDRPRTIGGGDDSEPKFSRRRKAENSHQDEDVLVTQEDEFDGSTSEQIAQDNIQLTQERSSTAAS